MRFAWVVMRDGEREKERKREREKEKKREREKEKKRERKKERKKERGRNRAKKRFIDRVKEDWFSCCILLCFIGIVVERGIKMLCEPSTQPNKSQPFRQIRNSKPWWRYVRYVLRWYRRKPYLSSTRATLPVSAITLYSFLHLLHTAERITIIHSKHDVTEWRRKHPPWPRP